MLCFGIDKLKMSTMNAAIPNSVPDPIIERLEDQIGWYDVHGRSTCDGTSSSKFWRSAPQR